MTVKTIDEPMTTLIFDGTWTGLLCCVFEIYERKIGLASLKTDKNFQPDAFGIAIRVVSIESNAKRVWTGLAKRISKKALGQLYSCYLSGLANIENVICDFVRLAFDSQESPEGAYAIPTVLRVKQVDRMVHREKHRMEAFVRFQLAKDNLYYACIDPDFNVLPLIARHFKNRYADQRWLIYDLKRKYGIYYDLEVVSEVQLEQMSNESLPWDLLHSDEQLYQLLWKDYFKHVNITERKNLKLHLMHVPRRYWKYLTEKLGE